MVALRPRVARYQILYATPKTRKGRFGEEINSPPADEDFLPAGALAWSHIDSQTNTDESLLRIKDGVKLYLLDNVTLPAGTLVKLPGVKGQWRVTGDPTDYRHGPAHHLKRNAVRYLLEKVEG